MTVEEVAARPGARSRRARLRRLRAGARVEPAPSTSTTSSRARSGRSRATPPCWPAGAPAARTSWSTRSRTSTEASFDSPSCWPRRRTGSSSSATTTRASTAGDSPTCAGCWGWPPTCPAFGASTSPSTTAARRPSSRARSGWWSTTRSASRRRSGRARARPAGSSWRRRRSASDPLPRLLAAWPRDGSSRAVLARTGASCSRPWRPAWPAGSRSGRTGVPLPLEDPRVDGLVAAAASSTVRAPDRRASRSRRRARARVPPTPRAPTPDDPDPEPTWTDAEIAAAVTGWAVRIAPADDLAAAIADARARLAELRRPDAPSRWPPRTPRRASSGTTSRSSA